MSRRRTKQIAEHRTAASRDPRGLVIPVLLLLLGLGTLLVGAGRDCLQLNAPEGSEALCQTTMEPGAAIFAAVCWLTALIVWLASRRS